MNKLIRFLGLAFVFNILMIHQIEAATLHAILVGDTIGGDDEIQSDIDYMKHEVRRIAALTDLKLNALSFTDYQVRTKNILDYISKLKVQPDDIVILYFNLHGSRAPEKENRWPDLNFAIDIGLSVDKGYLDFKDIHERVKSKNPRFLLSIADCCNAYRNSDSSDEDQAGSLNNQKNMRGTLSYNSITLSKSKIKFIKDVHEDTTEAYRSLFLNQKGAVIISSSSPGEMAIKYPIIGGVFTVQFLTILHDVTNYWEMYETRMEDRPWQFILEQASRATIQEVSLRGNEIHTPQYKIDLK